MSYSLNDYVQLSKKRKGYIRFEGKIPVVGDCYGVELDSKDKDGNDGSFSGEKYFDVKQGFGLFVKKGRIVSLITSAKDVKAQSPPPIATSNDNKSTPSKNGSKSPSKKKKKSTKTPKKDKKNNDDDKTTSNKPKSRREAMLKKKGRSATPRPRAATRDPRPMTLKKPQNGAIRTTPKRSGSRSPRKKIPVKYPTDGTNKEKLTYIFDQLLATTSSSSKAGHKKSSSEISKNKIDLIKKAIIIVKELENYQQDDDDINNLITPSFIINKFKKVFEPLLKDKKFAVHRGILRLFNCLTLCNFTRQGMTEQIVFSLKHLTNQLTNSNTKSVNAAKESMKLFIHEILCEDNVKLVKIMMNELLRYSKTSKKKIIRRNCWLSIVQILESKYNVKKQTKTAKPDKKDTNETKEEKEEKKEEKNDDDDDQPPVPKEVGDEKKTDKDSERRITKKNKPPKSIMDAISSGLKQGLNDNDKDVQIQAMQVLSLFSLLEETKADRLIAKMSTSTRKLFDSKYGGNGKRKKGKNNKLNGVGKGGKGKGKNGKGGAKKPSTKGRKRGDSGKKLFTLKEDPKSMPKDSKKGKGGKTGGKPKKPSTKNKGGKGKNGKGKGGKKDGGKSPKKTGDKSPKKTTEKNGTKSPKKVKIADIPPLDTSNDDDEVKKDVVEYALNEDDAEQTEIDMENVRKRRRERRGKKKRSQGSFLGGGNDNVGGDVGGVGFDLSALGGIVGDAAGSGSDSGDDGQRDDGDDDNNDNNNNNNDGDESQINGSSQMNAGMNGDARKDNDDDPYSSSTETYEGDNDIEIYEFPRKDALDNNTPKNGADFNIDIDRYLSNNNAEYNWKFGNEEMIFFSHKNNTHLLMSRISQIKKDENDDKEINYEDEEMSWINRLLEYPIDYDDLSLIKDTDEFWPTDIDPQYSQILNPNLNNNNNGIINGHGDSSGDDALYDNPELPPEDNDNNGDSYINNMNNNNNINGMPAKHEQHDFIVATQISYNLMRLLTNEHGSDWIKQFIEECIYEITVHALCVFHPLSNGNVYHGRVILEVLLNHFPRDFFKFLVEDSNIIQPLLKYAIFNNIHHGNLNSFVMDLICFDPESIQQRDDIMYHEKSKMAQETAEYKQTLLNTIFCDKWKFIPNIMKRACSKHCDDISTKYSVFFVDLVARCASIDNTKCLFNNQQDLIIDSFVNGLLGKTQIGKNLNFWQRIRCGQSLVEYLDLASRERIMDPSIAATPFGFMQAQNAFKENIFYPSFKYCLARLINYIPDLCMMIIGGGNTNKKTNKKKKSSKNNDDDRNKSPMKLIKLSYGDINKPLGRLKLNALELLTVTIDFHEMNCALVLQEIPDPFWNKIVDMAFVHKLSHQII